MAQELLTPGTKAPGFTSKDQNGNPVSLKDFKGKKVVLYFYPKDDTPGCTKEACNLRDNYGSLQDEGFEILGVSTDDEKSHTKFVDKYELPFTLLADTDKSIVNAYKAWGEKKMYGRTYEGTHRVTYVIGQDGKIEHVIKKVKTGEHAKQILDLYS